MLHPGCHLQSGWSFEWGTASAGDAGDAFIGPAGNGYTTFGPTGENGSVTTQIPSAGLTEIHLREVLQSGYIPFTFGSHPDNSASTSAQFYCANDALNYDNWDFIRNAVAGLTYHCVAFNALAATTSTIIPETPTEPPTTPIVPTFTNGNGIRSGSGPGLFASLPKPRVLGAATSTEACSPILTSYLRIGHSNPSSQVLILQAFLNKELGLSLPVTGFFGPMTEKAVEAFQAKYFSDVLAPWVPHGLASDHTTTGYVYKTTMRKINLVACSTLDIPAPSLP
jgi:hypothetical protein